MSGRREIESLTRGVPQGAPGTLVVANSEENNRIAVLLARQARFRVDILSRSLDPPVFDNLELVDAVKRLVLDHRLAKIRLLIKDPVPVVRFGHRLMTLAMHLSSFIEVRVPSADSKELDAAWMTVDDRGYLYRNFDDSYHGIASFHALAAARQYRREFDKIWETALLDPNFRQLKI